MGKRNQMEGGFAYRNSDKGTLENCYAAVRILNRKSENAGFVYDNRGSITHCFTRSGTHRWKHSRNDKKKQKDGLCSFNSGNISQSFFLAKKEKHLENYRDRSLGLPVKDADCPLLQEHFDWDFDIFEEKEAAATDFQKENWQYTFPDNEAPKEHIRSEKELMDIIERINRGDPAAVNGWYELEKDLNFHGKKLTPIGCDPEHPFCGVFDGKGHSIRGFVLNGKNMKYLGFFGVLQGTAANLRIDCIVKGKNAPLTAAFCGINHGEIHCCEAISEVHAKHYNGMFVGENHGLIERCHASGKSHGLFLLWLLPLFPFLALLALFIFNRPELPPDYKPVIADGSIVPNDDDQPKKRTNENKASFEVPKVLEIDADTLTASNKSYVIKNPNRGGDYDFVAAIYMTDSHKKQVKLYQSGRIPVGYHIKKVTLKPPAGITLSDGTYDAEIVFSFYQKDSGEKGMIDSRVPLKIKIQ